MSRPRRGLVVALCAAVLTLTACTSSSNTPAHSSHASAAAGTDVNHLDAGTRAYLADNATALAKQLGISDPPAVKPVKLVTLDEWASAQISCLKGAGYDVSETSDGQGIHYPRITDPALSKSLNLAIYTCEVKYPTQQKYMAPLSPTQLKSLYEYRVGPLSKCLSKLGYHSSSTPPSETVFVQDGGMWSPYDGMGISQNDVKRVFKACPQTPESIYDE